MLTINDVHLQFANYFDSEILKPYIYILSKKLSEGHICIKLDGNYRDELTKAGFYNVPSIKNLEKDNLISTGVDYKPFILFDNRLYLQRYFHYETIILEKIKELTDRNSTNEALLLDHKEFIINLFKDTSEKEDHTNWQLAAAITAVLSDFSIITGGPGTGKTFTVAKILSILFTINPNLKVALTAPTGKAAARMGESLKSAANDVGEGLRVKFELLQPSTIHRLLGGIRNSPHFKYNSENILNYDVVIADESSMIDSSMFAKLLDAIGPETKLILLGDKDQLASIEAGSLFGDLCQAQEKLNMFSSDRINLINSFIGNTAEQIPIHHTEVKTTHPLFQHIIELQYSRRFSDDKGIGKFSKAIINNREVDIKDFILKGDEDVKIDAGYNEELLMQFVTGYEAFIKEPDVSRALEKVNHLRVLCAVREGEQGVYKTNKKIEKYLQLKGLIQLTGDFYEHRPIMISSNNYELGLFNGDVGIVRMDAETNTLKVWFKTADGEVKSVLPGYISNAETVYAMTIHKSQGSEFEKVFVILPMGEDIPILTRELLYTAVTRARKKVFVQGTEASILQSSKANVQRGSGIIERLKQGI
ncbi:exodeoxyribonuclease V subunit alpha [Mucilaginibacter sp.]|uniref:exodeoxyribonuclease V subunit alpha n=1 Tax=Mucilaginibacter sp. TaxID=1882438 RepID=UPI00374D0F2A